MPSLTTMTCLGWTFLVALTLVWAWSSYVLLGVLLFLLVLCFVLFCFVGFVVVVVGFESKLEGI